MQARRLFWLTAPARALLLLSMGAPILWDRNQAALVTLAAISFIWVAAQAAVTFDQQIGVPPTVEAAAVGLICGVSIDASTGFLPALAMAPYVAGLLQGSLAVGLALSSQLITFTFCAYAIGGLDTAAGLGAFTWTIAGLGLGLIASFMHSTVLQREDELAHYRYAQSLIRQLIDISGGLSSGLDVNSLGGQILSTTRDTLPTSSISLYLPQGETLVPLITKTTDQSTENVLAEELALKCWSTGEQVVHEDAFAFPLGDRAVIAGVLARPTALRSEQLAALLGQVRTELAANAVHLDTAILFADFRDRASADERNRLAREMHDGIAQDIASLGYLVDALAARPANDKQTEQFQMLRERITNIVAEVRQSVLTLRTSIGESESLGAAISTVARHLSESSGIPIHVTLDEHSMRLRPDVEAELFRISQEAMNNAIKHAQANSIHVHCQVHAPAALITVSDDGRGMQEARDDSYGLKIMRERAGLINGQLEVGPSPTGGLQVSVKIGSQTSPNSFRASQFGVTVTP